MILFCYQSREAPQHSAWVGSRTGSFGSKVQTRTWPSPCRAGKKKAFLHFQYQPHPEDTLVISANGLIFIHSLFLVFFLAMKHVGSWFPSMETMPPAVEAGSPNHWTARKFPLCFFFSFFFFFGGGTRRVTRGRMEEKRRCLLRTNSW